MWNKIKPYVISVAIALAVGGLSALLTRNGMTLYQDNIQPPLSPPMWLFPVVWSILYILMGIGAARVYLKHMEMTEEVTGALVTYAFQLAVNFFWSLIFFNLRAYLFAFIWLVLLWLLIIAMIVKFKKIDRLAAWLQIPYLIWVTFAGYLTFAVWVLNK